MNPKKLTTMALLSAFALIIFIVEAQIPSPIAIPGIKLGLANVITLFAIFTLTPTETFIILIVRIILANIFAGQITTFFYSLSGGLMCFFATFWLKYILSQKQIWVAGVLGAIFHNVGQIITAAVLTRTPAVFAYLPILLFSGIITGVFTGLCTQFFISHYRKIRRR
ncbi:MAG: Gx transporter family protein [Clostridia bacterium]|nr:Gx transporter family protein [Clostridia bacterium]